MLYFPGKCPHYINVSFYHCEWMGIDFFFFYLTAFHSETYIISDIGQNNICCMSSVPKAVPLHFDNGQLQLKMF